MPGMTWAQVFKVTADDEWPSNSLTTFVGTPDDTIRLAAVCRVSCSRIRGTDGLDGGVEPVGDRRRMIGTTELVS